MDNIPEEKVVNDWSNEQNEIGQNAQLSTEQNKAQINQTEILCTSIARVISATSPLLWGMANNVDTLGVKAVKPIKTQYDIDPTIDSKAVIFAKRALKVQFHLPPKQQLALIKALIDERSNVNAALFALIDNAGDAVYSHDNNLDMRGDIKKLESSRDDATDLYPKLYKD